MRVEDVVHGTAIAGDVSVRNEVEGISEKGLQEERVGAAGQPIDGVVGAHDAVDAGVARCLEELRHVVLGQVLLGDLHVVAETRVAVPVLDVVACEVLCRCNELEVFWVDSALDTGDVFVGVGRGETVGVLAGCLLPTAPDGVAEAVDVGCVGVKAEPADVVEGAGLGGEDFGDVVDEGAVEGGHGQDRLGKGCRPAVFARGGPVRAGEAVKRLAPYLVVGETQSGRASTGVSGVVDQLFEGKHRDKGGGAVFRPGGLVAHEGLAEGTILAVGEGELDSGDALREEIRVGFDVVVDVAVVRLCQCRGQQGREDGDSGRDARHVVDRDSLAGIDVCQDSRDQGTLSDAIYSNDWVNAQPALNAIIVQHPHPQLRTPHSDLPIEQVPKSIRWPRCGDSLVLYRSSPPSSFQAESPVMRHIHRQRGCSDQEKFQALLHHPWA